MSDNLNYRMAHRKDMLSLLSFLKPLHPTLGWTEEFMKWLYFENPAGEAKVWICLDGKKLVGSVTALPHVLWLHDRKAVGYRVQDVLTDPNYRGRSIYRKLSEACYAFLDEDETATHFTFPNEKSDRVFRTSGWSAVGEIPLWRTSPPKQKGSCVLPEGCRQLSVFSTAEENVWDSMRREGVIGIDRNVAFLNWKYFGNPRAEYLCYRMDRKESNVVFILKKFHSETGDIFLHVCDLFYSRFHKDVLKDIFSFILARAAAEKSHIITTWLAPTKKLAAFLSSMGFIYSPVTSRSYFLRSSNTAAHIYFSSWNIRMGDSDVY
jgi:hypothetical protein